MAQTNSDFAIGFASQLKELDGVSLPVQGVVPDWLSGNLVRNGPAQFEAGQESYRHWFDGLAKLHKFSFAAGHVKLSSKFLETEAYTKAISENRVALPEFATNPRRSLWEKLSAVFNQQLTDNANVNIVSVANHYLALTETTKATEFEIGRLSTKGPFAYSDELKGQVTTAHPHYDFDRKCLYNLLIKLGPSSSYVIYRLDEGSTQRRPIASIAVKEPAYFHSFAMSANYIILVECPLVVNPLNLLIGQRTYIESYSWKPKQGTKISVYSKDDGQLIVRAETESMFCFHHVNAFERDGQLLVDLLAYADNQIIESTYLSNLRSDKGQIPLAKLRRLSIDIASGNVNDEYLSPLGFELGRIHYEKFNGKPYRYLYAPGQVPGRTGKQFLDQLVKFDLEKNEALFWQQDLCYPGEPVFISRPGANNEDDGVLVSVVLDAGMQQSFLLILDAQTMNELARLEIPMIVPFGFHGQFCRT